MKLSFLFKIIKRNINHENSYKIFEKRALNYIYMDKN